MTKPLYWVWDDDENTKYLSTDFESCGDNYRAANRKDVSLEQLADMLDREAEDANFHQFVGSHRGLAFLLYGNCGRENATNIFWELALLEGLQGLEGNLAKLGIPGCWAKWSLEDTPD